MRFSMGQFFFSVHLTATTVTYTLSLHDALPISFDAAALQRSERGDPLRIRDPEVLLAVHDQHRRAPARHEIQDRKSTRLNSSHRCISYAVFCLKKKNKTTLLF